MKGRQTIPTQWLVADERIGEGLWRALRKMPPGSGVLFLYRNVPKAQRARLFARVRRLARAKRLLVVDEASGGAARVHDLEELRNAQLAGAPLLFLSPIFATRSHPDWKPLRRMEASAIVRLAGKPVIALGGMNARRFRQVEPHGFSGWAGIDAYGH